MDEKENLIRDALDVSNEQELERREYEEFRKWKANKNNTIENISKQQKQGFFKKFVETFKENIKNTPMAKKAKENAEKEEYMKELKKEVMEENKEELKLTIKEQVKQQIIKEEKDKLEGKTKGSKFMEKLAKGFEMPQGADMGQRVASAFAFDGGAMEKDSNKYASLMGQPQPPRQPKYVIPGTKPKKGKRKKKKKAPLRKRRGPNRGYVAPTYPQESAIPTNFEDKIRKML